MAKQNSSKNRRLERELRMGVSGKILSKILGRYPRWSRRDCVERSGAGNLWSVDGGKRLTTWQDDVKEEYLYA